MSEQLAPTEYVGQKVIVTGASGAEWRGVAIAQSDRPTILLELGDGMRVMLPSQEVRLAVVPQPWHEAKPGEVWAATVYGTNEAALTVMEYSEEGIVFMDHVEEEMFELTSEDVTNARRIFPDVVSDDS